MTVTSAVPGIPSPSRLVGWISQRTGGELAERSDIQPIKGGRSNLTYRLTVSGPAGDRLVVLRRPPLGRAGTGPAGGRHHEPGLPAPGRIRHRIRPADRA